jgi:hypothetical protein
VLLDRIVFANGSIELVYASQTARSHRQELLHKATRLQQGSSLRTAGIDYSSLQAMQAMKRLQQLKALSPPRN